MGIRWPLIPYFQAAWLIFLPSNSWRIIWTLYFPWNRCVCSLQASFRIAIFGFIEEWFGSIFAYFSNLESYLSWLKNWAWLQNWSAQLVLRIEMIVVKDRPKKSLIFWTRTHKHVCFTFKPENWYRYSLNMKLEIRFGQEFWNLNGLKPFY